MAETALISIVVLLLGGVIGWFVRASRARAEIEAARLGSGPELALAQQRATQLQSQLRDTLQQFDESVKQKEATLEQLRDESTRRASLEATLNAERRGFEEKLKLLGEAKTALSDAFNALSANALRSNSEEFLKLAQSSVAPIKEALGKFETKVQALEVAREGAYQGLVQQVTQLLDTGKELRSETANLVQALRSPVTRGQWGEIQLRRVVEMAGMLNYCDFVEQATVAGEGGNLRPDLVVRLPAGRTIVVDAKAPISGYIDAMAIDSEVARKVKLQAFAKLVRDHVTALGRKSYWDQFQDTPELVVMFLPGDHFYSAALQADPSLIEFGVDQKVLIATPVNLIGLLRAIAFGWRQEAIAANAKEISELGAELYKRIADLGGHWVELRAHLSRTVDAFNSAVGSLESRVMVSARRFRELGAASSAQDIAPLERVDTAPRPLKEVIRPVVK
jgi:DNA recombination protein RmuC